MYREKTTGAILRAEFTPRKVAVYFDYREHCGMPSWMTRAEFRKRFEPVTLCVQLRAENLRARVFATCV
jgi:hypothetical protein